MSSAFEPHTALLLRELQAPLALSKSHNLLILNSFICEMETIIISTYSAVVRIK